MKLTAAFLSLATAVAFAAEDKVFVPFWDAAGTRYSTDSYVPQIQERFPNTIPTLLLVVTRSFQEPKFKEQRKALESVDAEGLRLLFAFGSTSETDKHSYWVSSEAAKSLLGPKAPFKVFVIGAEGVVCSIREQPVKSEAIGLLTSGCSRRASRRSGPAAEPRR